MGTGKQSAPKTKPDDRPIDRPTGWLDAWRRPEALPLMRAARGKARVRWLAMTLTPIALGLAAGLALGGRWRFDLESGAVLGIMAAGIIQLWALPPVIAHAARPWEGVVVKLEKVRLPRRTLSAAYYPAVHATGDRADVRERYMTEYTVVCKTGARRRRAIRFPDDIERFRYFNEGDRVRYCPALGTFEKFDRAGDDAIYCPLCGARSAVGHARCDACDRPLFAGQSESHTPSNE